VSSNQASFTPGGDGIALAAYTAVTFANDQSAQAVITHLTGGINGVSCRTSNSAVTAYWYYGNAGNSYIQKDVAGTGTVLVTTGVGFAVGDTIRIECRGTTITAYKNNVQTGTVTDSSIASGYPGIVGANASGPLLDNFRGGELTWSTTSNLSVPSIKVGNATWTSTAGVPSGNCAVGDIDSNTSASTASTVLYVCAPANTWTAVTVP
jgi:hypothetical protein